MPTIRLPQAGNTANATVRRWLRKGGETVSKGDILLEVETEQGLVQIESPVNGKLGQMLVEVGKTIAVNTPVAEVQAAEAAVASTSDKSAQAQTVAPPGGSIIPILMPKAGQSMEEGTIVKWHVKAGDRITKGQVIFEVETDKATMDVEATDAGRVAKIVLPEGGTLKVLEPVAFLAENDADVEAFIAAGASGAKAQSGEATDRRSEEGQAVVATAARVAPAPMSDGGRVKASPAARKIALEKGIHLAAVGAGSGPGGRILSTDVLSAKPAAAKPVATGSGSRRKMSKMRKAIADNLLISKQTIPHFYIRATVNAEAMQAFYQGEKAKYPCSVNDVVVLACSRAIMEFPAFRSHIEGDEMVETPNANVGIAVGMDEGLVVPVLIAAQQMSLQQIGAESKRIANSARAGKIEGRGQGVFTITNLGMFGTEEFSAIINPPEAAILAVGAIREQVIVQNGMMRPGKVMTMTLSADHRVIDGMLAAKFMARLKEMLENPTGLI